MAKITKNTSSQVESSFNVNILDNYEGPAFVAKFIANLTDKMPMSTKSDYVAKDKPWSDETLQKAVTYIAEDGSGIITERFAKAGFLKYKDLDDAQKALFVENEEGNFAGKLFDLDCVVLSSYDANPEGYVCVEVPALNDNRQAPVFINEKGKPERMRIDADWDYDTFIPKKTDLSDEKVFVRMITADTAVPSYLLNNMAQSLGLPEDTDFDVMFETALAEKQAVNIKVQNRRVKAITACEVVKSVSQTVEDDEV